MSSPSHPAFNLSQHQGLFPMSQFFASGGQSIGVSASASVPSKEYSGLISFRMDWFDIFAVQGALKSLLPGGSVVKNLPVNARDTGLIPDPRRSYVPESN